MIQVNSGKIFFRGEDITGLDPRKIVELGLIHVPQENQLFPEMSVQESMTLGAYVARATKGKTSDFEKVFTLFPRLKERRSQRAQTLSGGERQMLSIGVGLMGTPELLILDEPSVGLAPLIKEELARAIGEIATGGVHHDRGRPGRRALAGHLSGVYISLRKARSRWRRPLSRKLIRPKSSKCTSGKVTG